MRAPGRHRELFRVADERLIAAHDEGGRAGVVEAIEADRILGGGEVGDRAHGAARAPHHAAEGGEARARRRPRGARGVHDVVEQVRAAVLHRIRRIGRRRVGAGVGRVGGPQPVVGAALQRGLEDQLAGVEGGGLAEAEGQREVRDDADRIAGRRVVAEDLHRRAGAREQGERAALPEEEGVLGAVDLRRESDPARLVEPQVVQQEGDVDRGRLGVGHRGHPFARHQEETRAVDPAVDGVREEGLGGGADGAEEGDVTALVDQWRVEALEDDQRIAETGRGLAEQGHGVDRLRPGGGGGGKRGEPGDRRDP